MWLQEMFSEVTKGVACPKLRNTNTNTKRNTNVVAGDIFQKRPREQLVLNFSEVTKGAACPKLRSHAIKALSEAMIEWRRLIVLAGTLPW